MPESILKKRIQDRIGRELAARLKLVSPVDTGRLKASIRYVNGSIRSVHYGLYHLPPLATQELARINVASNS